jgi:hypothetical protein
MDPQYTTARIPEAISHCAVLTSASKSGIPSREQGVMIAGMQPRKIELSGMLVSW